MMSPGLTHNLTRVDYLRKDYFYFTFGSVGSEACRHITLVRTPAALDVVAYQPTWRRHQRCKGLTDSLCKNGGQYRG
jgi:hypothetical protein